MVCQPHRHDYSHPCLWLVVRARVDLLSIADSARQPVDSVESESRLGAFKQFRSLEGWPVAPRLFFPTTVGWLSLPVFVLVGLGVYGGAARLMSRQARDRGIRCALRALVEAVRRDLVPQGKYPASIALGAGFACAYGLASPLRWMFFGGGPMDCPVDHADCGVIVLGALLACFAPVRRAPECKMTDVSRTP